MTVIVEEPLATVIVEEPLAETTRIPTKSLDLLVKRGAVGTGVSTAIAEEMLAETT